MLAIQIDEKLLSNEAKYALSNAKSKSQLLRDALEYYVRRGSTQIIQGPDNTEITRDVKEIKSTINDLINLVKNQDVLVSSRLNLDNSFSENNNKSNVSLEDNNKNEVEIKKEIEEDLEKETIIPGCYD